MKAKAKAGRVLKSGCRIHPKRSRRKRITSPVKPRALLKASAVNLEQLILDHRDNGRKLARSLLRRWRVRMLSEEIDSIVDLTLCEAARRYSTEHGASFMTFLFYHLRGNLVRAVAMAAKSNNFVVAFGRTAGIDVGDWAMSPELSSRDLLSEFSVLDGGDTLLPEQILLRREQIELCRSACAQLDLLEREVLNRLFVDGEALVDIARSLGYSRCHISRVKRRALERLRGLLQHLSGDQRGKVKSQVVGGTETLVSEVTDLTKEQLPDNVRLFRRRSGRRIAARVAEAEPIVPLCLETLPRIAAA